MKKKAMKRKIAQLESWHNELYARVNVLVNTHAASSKAMGTMLITLQERLDRATWLVVGAVVWHPKFESGVVTLITPEYVTVKFDNGSWYGGPQGVLSYYTGTEEERAYRQAQNVIDNAARCESIQPQTS